MKETPLRIELGDKPFFDFIAAVQSFARAHETECWFRGHSNAEWSLVPSVFRTASSALAESATAARFRRAARIRHRDCPPRDDLSAWLQLMQHYRLPTRLLDWTESPLIALFFAVEANPQDDAIVWCLNPFGLAYKGYGEATVASPDDGRASALLAQPFAQLAERTDLAIPMLGDEVDIRMLMQMAAFTLHGNERPLEQRPEAAGILTGIHIPAKLKAHMRTMLEVLGIRRSNIFPDLESLSRELSEAEWKFLDEELSRDGSK
ncbi:MAG: FRG domain-containing protein [Gemmatimonadales bacterium]|nr:FRG domain-containing protein [Gemmatimonadales bacterium]